jgi:dTDP-glucose 4,6-dehydratase
MPLTINRALILGSNAFTAAHFIDYLLANTDAEIVGISRSPEYHPVFLPYAANKARAARFRFHQLRVTTQLDDVLRICDAFRPDLVVNFAAQGEVRNSWKWPEQWWETNAMAVVRLAEALRQRDYLRRYVAVSTPEVYGSTGEDVRESHCYQPSTPYGASKLAGDLHLLTLFKRYDFPVVFTRAANLYGAHQQLYRIIPRAAIYAKLGRKLELHNRGLTRRAFIHARDVADGTWRAVTRGRSGEVYHLAPDREIFTVAEVVELVSRQLGLRLEDVATLSVENFGQDSLFSLNADKARDELGWKPQVKFADGVAETIRWVGDNFDFIKTQPLEYVHQA